MGVGDVDTARLVEACGARRCWFEKDCAMEP